MNEVYAEISNPVSNERTFEVYQPFSATVACVYEFITTHPRRLYRYEGVQNRVIAGTDEFKYYISVYSEGKVHTQFVTHITLRDRNKHTELVYMYGGTQIINLPSHDEEYLKRYQDRAGIFDKFGTLKDYFIRVANEINALLDFLTKTFDPPPKRSLVDELQNNPRISGAWRLAQYQQLASKYAAAINPDPNITVVEAIAEDHHIHIYIRHILIHCAGLNGQRLKTEHIPRLVNEDDGSIREHGSIAHAYFKKPEDKDRELHIFQLKEIQIAFDNIAKELNAFEEISPPTTPADDVAIAIKEQKKRRGGPIPTLEDNIQRIIDEWQKVKGTIPQELFCAQKAIGVSTLTKWMRDRGISGQ